MVKLNLPDFVKAVASAFKQVVTERVMQAISKGAAFASALSGMRSIATPQPLTPAPVRVSPRSAPPPTRGGVSR